MAVQQNKKSRARRDMRRSHDHALPREVSIDSATGELHLRHHVTPNGFFKGRRVTAQKSEE